MLHKMDIRPTGGFNRAEILPHPLPAFLLKTPKLAVAVNTIDELSFEKRSRNTTMERFGVSFVLSFNMPDFFSPGFVSIELQQHRSIVKAAHKQKVVIKHRSGDANNISFLFKLMLPVERAVLRV